MSETTKALGSLPLKTTLADTDQIIIADGAAGSYRVRPVSAFIK